MTKPRILRDELESFVPHSGSMLFLESIVSWTEDFLGLTARARVTPGSPFSVDHGKIRVPVIIGFEYMAQAMAALSGLKRYLKGDTSPRLGYIIGVRNYRGHSEYLPVDIDIIIEEIFRDGPVASFHCRIESGQGRKVAEGTINAFEPMWNGSDEK